MCHLVHPLPTEDGPDKLHLEAKIKAKTTQFPFYKKKKKREILFTISSKQLMKEVFVSKVIYLL